MMAGTLASKVAPRHLERIAYLYVRQSTIRQVRENTESTQRQYGLRERALALGWTPDRVVVLDADQGRSGASSSDRSAFQQLVSEVGLGHAGIVMGLEVSRLARNNADWHRLLELCGLTDTLILEDERVYDPMDINDRLLLGLKGTMSEVELHVIRARLRGGILSKASRGELRISLPVGLVYDDQGRVALDPDQEVQQTLRHFFLSFARIESAHAVVRRFRAERVRIPRRVRHGPGAGDLVWEPLSHGRAMHLLHNPRYAGAYVYGKQVHRRNSEGNRTSQALPSEQWKVLLRDAHPGYISWDAFERNQVRLRESAQAYRGEHRRFPPREGPALLQGRVVCGRCGQRMTVRYDGLKGGVRPVYTCQREMLQHGGRGCQVIPGAAVDDAVSASILEALTPVAIQAAARVYQEQRDRWEETERLRRQQVDRLRYETELARRRFLRVDPDHRLVAENLEREWNEKLRTLREGEQALEADVVAAPPPVTEEQRTSLRRMVEELPRRWRDPSTPFRDKKRMLAHLVEDVTLVRGSEKIAAHVRFRGGKEQTLSIPLPLPAWALRQTAPETVKAMDELMENHTPGETAAELNRRELRTGSGRLFTVQRVEAIRRAYGLKSRHDRLRARGFLTAGEMATRLGITVTTVVRWRRKGWLRTCAYNDRGTEVRNSCLYDPRGVSAPRTVLTRAVNFRRRRSRHVMEDEP